MLNTIFNSPFSAEYWKTAFSEMKKLKMIIIAAVFIALRVAISSLKIPVGENLAISLSFIVTAAGSMIFGPVVGLVAGLASDTLTWLVFQSAMYPYFIGYALTEMLGYFVYALFFYRTKISLIKIISCKIVVNGILNVLLGSLWSSIMYSKGYYYYFAKSLLKNSLLLPAEVFILYLVLSVALRAAKKCRVIPDATPEKISII